jgi:hypothetical protein
MPFFSPMPPSRFFSQMIFLPATVLPPTISLAIAAWGSLKSWGHA